MLDTSSYLSGEIRNLAFRKGAEHSTWQDAVKPQQTTENEARLCKVSKNNLLIDLSRALLHPFIRSKRSASESYVDGVQAQQSPVALGTNLPSHHKAG